MHQHTLERRRIVATNQDKRLKTWLLQIVGIYANVSHGNAASKYNGWSSSTRSSVGQAAPRIAATQTSESATQTITNIAQTVAPQVGQILNDVANIAGSQNTAGTNSNGNSGTTGAPSIKYHREFNGNENSKRFLQIVIRRMAIKLLIQIATTLILPLLLSNGNTQKVVQITTNPKSNTTKPNELTSNKPEET